MVDRGRAGQGGVLEVVAFDQVRGGAGTGMRGDAARRLSGGEIERHCEVGSIRHREVQRVGARVLSGGDGDRRLTAEGDRPGCPGLDPADSGRSARWQCHRGGGDWQGRAAEHVVQVQPEPRAPDRDPDGLT